MNTSKKLLVMYKVIVSNLHKWYVIVIEMHMYTDLKLLCALCSYLGILLSPGC
jgi:hypothetical protein